MVLPDRNSVHMLRQLTYYSLMSGLIGVLGGLLFTMVWSFVGEDTGVLLFFVGLPSAIAASFIAMVVVSQRVFQQVINSEARRLAGLLAAVVAGLLAVGVPRLLLSIRVAMPDTLLSQASSITVISIWVAALLISSLLFSLLRRR